MADEDVVTRLRAAFTRTELGRQATNVQTGIFHLRLALEAFDGLPDADTSDLADFLEEAEAAHATLTEAAGQ